MGQLSPWSLRPWSADHGPRITGRMFTYLHGESSMLYALVSSVALGMVSTLGDFVWEALGLRHRMVYGLVHGAVICLAIGAVIGIRERRLAPAIAAGPVIGVIAASGFYLLAPRLRYGAMFPMWMLFWLCFALLQEWLGERFSLRTGVLRGLTAAVVSGLAFYAISGIWTRPSPEGPNYVRHFLSWSLAFLPGFLALFLGRRRRSITDQLSS